jgi:hypothetical protein
MESVKIPLWWGNEQKSRPSTTHIKSARSLRTRTDLLTNRKNNNRQSAIKFSHDTISSEPWNEILFAGTKTHSRDARDKLTTQMDFAMKQEHATIKFQQESLGNMKKYSSLSALKEGRLNAERRETQMKADELFRIKSSAVINRYQTHHNLAKKKVNVKSKLKLSRSQVDINDYDDPRNPSLKYVDDPPIKTQKTLLVQRKKDFLKDMRKCEKIYDNHINPEERLNYREEWITRLGAKESKIIKKVREEFEPNVRYGIHSKPLPTYSKYNKEWWTVQKGYNTNPKETSQLKLMHKILKGNPNDYLLLQDKNAKETRRVKSKIKRKNSDITGKPNNVKIIYKGKVTKKKPTNLRWTEVEHAYSQKKHRIFQTIDEATHSLADLEPLYSSFTPRKVFKPPPSSKEC